MVFQSVTYPRIYRRDACAKPLCNTLHQFAWQTTQSEPWALEYSQRTQKEGKSHTVALRTLVNVWRRLIHAMWLKSEVYQAATFEQARQFHARRTA